MLTLVLGGARSGKSRYAQSLCTGDAVVYVATATIADGDAEMAERIARHRRERPATWTTIEAPVRVPEAVRAVAENASVVVDCVTIWVSNLLEHHDGSTRLEREAQVLSAVAELCELAKTRLVIAVSNDVGSGIVPMHPVGREFRDLQGVVNQRLAREAATVVLIIAGLPLKLKGQNGVA
jgi:adenosyl cobinamide kinase/adenosyl cobinamide phosphate guanylyltransferase